MLTQNPSQFSGIGVLATCISFKKDIPLYIHLKIFGTQLLQPKFM